MNLSPDMLTRQTSAPEKGTTSGVPQNDAGTNAGAGMGKKPIGAQIVWHNFPVLTAAEIACAFGVSSQAIRKKLRAVHPTGKKSFSGNLADSWNWSALPDAIRSRLVREAASRGFDTVGAWHRNGFNVWTPPVPMAQISDGCLSDAAKLRLALLPSLRKPFDVSQTDFEREGLDDFEKEFGHRISGRHFRELIRRTVERDGGAENWERLELYLPKCPARKPKATEPKPDFPLLVQAINDVLPEDEIWKKTFATLNEMVKAGNPRNRAARQLRNFLCERAPGLAPNREALRKTFDRRLHRWESGESFDKRADNGPDDGEVAKQIKALDWFIPAARFFYLLTNRTNNTGSTPEAVLFTISLPNLPAGWPDGLKTQLLKKLGVVEMPSCPKELRETILARRKAYSPLVPTSIARQIVVNPDIVQYFRSPREWSLNNLSAPGSQRRFFNLATNQREIMQPGDWFGGDDATPGIAVCVPCNEVITPCSQNFGVLLGRFQWLAYNDCRTDKILAWDYVVRPRGSYRAEDILNGMGAVVRTHGIPRQGFQFEGGTFAAKLVKQAINLLGCQHWQTHSPRAKAIESVFNRVWTRLAAQFPHADMGRYRNENEANCKLYEACKRGHKDPRRYFPPLELVTKVFDEIVAAHNAKPIDSRQYGRWVPDDFFAQSVEKYPLREMLPDSDWIFSPFTVERTVRGCLVSCKVPMFEDFSVPFEFSADWLPMHNGRKVRLHFDPRRPKCAAKVVLLENSGERAVGDVLGDAILIGETAQQIRFILQWAVDDQRAGFVTKQKNAHFMRRETRGIGADGRVEYSRSENRDGMGQIGIIERGSVAKIPVEDDKARSRQRLARNMGTDLPAFGRSTQRAAESEAEIIELERRCKDVFV